MSNQLFDGIAKKYDTEKQIELAKIIEVEVLKELNESKDKALLDYGSGTGLVSLGLSDYVKELFLVDSSKEMTAIATQKISEKQITNAKAVCHNLLEEEFDLKVDIILVSLVLLHIPNTELILIKLYNQLKSGGQLIIVDFDLNEKINDSRVHNGFEQNDLKGKLLEAGFKDTSSRIFYKGKELFMKQDASLVLTLGSK